MVDGGLFAACLGPALAVCTKNQVHVNRGRLTQFAHWQLGVQLQGSISYDSCRSLELSFTGVMYRLGGFAFMCLLLNHEESSGNQDLYIRREHSRSSPSAAAQVPQISNDGGEPRAICQQGQPMEQFQEARTACRSLG